jgi:hypothetical protein
MLPLSLPVFPPGTRAKSASGVRQIERTPFFWGHYVRSFTIFFSERHSGRLRRINVGAGLRQRLAVTQPRVGLINFQLPKVLNSNEDAHIESMSTFETDELLRAETSLHRGRVVGVPTFVR